MITEVQVTLHITDNNCDILLLCAALKVNFYGWTNCIMCKRIVLFYSRAVSLNASTHFNPWRTELNPICN
jgi:hypothetical protein